MASSCVEQQLLLHRLLFCHSRNIMYSEYSKMLSLSVLKYTQFQSQNKKEGKDQGSIQSSTTPDNPQYKLE